MNVLLGVCVIAVVISVVSAHLDRKRTSAWKALARKLDLRFVGEDPELSRRSSFGEHWENVLQGRVAGGEVTLGEYSWTTCSGPTTYKTHWRTACIVMYDPNALQFPGFRLRSRREVLFFPLVEGFVSVLEERLRAFRGRRGGWPGSRYQGEKRRAHKGRFQGDGQARAPGFSELFVLECSEDVRALFEQRLRPWSLASGDWDLSLEGSGPTLIVTSAWRLAPGDAQRLLDRALGLAEAWAGRRHTSW